MRNPSHVMQRVLARYVEMAKLDFFPRLGCIVIGTNKNPGSEIIAAVAARVPNGSPRRATYAQRNFLLLHAIKIDPEVLEVKLVPGNQQEYKYQCADNDL